MDNKEQDNFENYFYDQQLYNCSEKLYNHYIYLKKNWDCFLGKGNRLVIGG